MDLAVSPLIQPISVDLCTWHKPISAFAEDVLCDLDGPLKSKTSVEWWADVKMNISSLTTHVLETLIREIDSLSRDDSHKFFIHMTYGPQGEGTQPIVLDMTILDSGSPFHCTGDRSLFSQYTEAPGERYIYGASGRRMPVYGTGSIRNRKFQVEDVLYVPDLNHQPNINKTIFSVTMLTMLGCSVEFNPDGTCTVIDKRERTWTRKHKIVGSGRIEHEQYILEYLRIPPVSTSDGPGLVKSLWDAALSGWSAITNRLSQRARAPTLPV